MKLTLESDLENILPDIVEVISKLEPEVEVIDVKEKVVNDEKYTLNFDIIRLFLGIVFAILGSFIRFPWKINLVFD